MYDQMHLCSSKGVIPTHNTKNQEPSTKNQELALRLRFIKQQEESFLMTVSEVELRASHPDRRLLRENKFFKSPGRHLHNKFTSQRSSQCRWDSYQRTV